MATNRDWLFSLPLEEQYAWMNAEHTESPTSETMQHIGQVIDDTVMRGVYGDTEPQDADSRDKIEADVRKIAEAYNMDTQRHGTERFEYELYYSIIHLLNRQRAIDDSICDECSSDYYDMQEEHDQMVDGVARIMRLKQPYTFDPGEPLKNIEIIGRYIDELAAERDKLKDELIDERGELNRQINTMRDVIRDYRNERDRYRSKFGKCLDYADAIHALMDDEGMA